MPTNQPSVKQQREQQRRAKLAAVQAAQAREQRNKRLAIGVAIAIGVGILTWPVVLTIRAAADNGETTVSTASLEDVETTTPVQGHVTTPVTYEQDPPAGGEHDPAWLNCGVYTEPVRNENAVHAQEHGAVWVTYQPDLPAADVEKLTGSLPDTYTVLSPYPGLEAPVVASAWGAQLSLTGVDDERLSAFVQKYRQGGTAPEIGASCTGGVDGTGQPAAS